MSGLPYMLIHVHAYIHTHTNAKKKNFQTLLSLKSVSMSHAFYMFLWQTSMPPAHLHPAGPFAVPPSHLKSSICMKQM